MSLKERLLKKQSLFDKEKAGALALWIRENEQDLRDLLESNIPVREIRVEAITDLSEQYPNEVNFEAALYFSLLQLEAVKKEQSNIVNIPIIEKVEDLEKVEKQKIQAEIEPFRVGYKKYYYAKYVMQNEECELVKLSVNKKSVQQSLYNKRDKTFDAYGNPVSLDIIEVRYATQDELIRMGIKDAGENR